MDNIQSPIKITKLLWHQTQYKVIMVGIAVAFLFLFGVATGQITFTSEPSITAQTAQNIGETLFQSRGGLSYEPVLLIQFIWVEIFINPLNFLLATALAVLTALNIAYSILAFRQPKACDLNKTTGIIAMFPSFLAGSACCAPTIFLILGLQITSVTLAVFEFLLPLTALLLLGNLYWVTQKISVDTLRTE